MLYTSKYKAAYVKPEFGTANWRCLEFKILKPKSGTRNFRIKYILLNFKLLNFKSVFLDSESAI